MIPIGFVFNKRNPRENLDDIVIIPKLPKPVDGTSWWTTAVKDGFTKVAEKLFKERQPLSTDEQFRKKRPSNWDAQ